MLRITRNLVVPDDEIELSAVRAAGPGGQHGDKAATAVHLRFDVRASSLPERCKQHLLALPDQRVSGDGVVVIKAQTHRSRDRNVQDARARLAAMIRAAATPRPRRHPTRPGPAARRRRTDDKKQRGRRKALRKPPAPE